MRRAIAPLIAVGIIVAASLFAVFAPIVPSSTHTSKSGSTTGCPTGVTVCVIPGPDVQGYGSITFRLFGVGGVWFNGAYRVATSSDLNISLTA